MARNTKLVDLNTINEINLTPMMDLVFVLLIIFMITFPMIENQVPIKLPGGQTGLAVEDPTALQITVDHKGDLFLGKQRTNPPQLVAALKDARSLNPGAEVNIRGDEELPYGQIMDVIRMLNEADITNLGLVTDGKKGGGN